MKTIDDVHREIREAIVELGLPLHLVPTALRPLPDLEHFHYLPALKKHSIDKALLHLYANVPLPAQASVVLFTWMIGDGLGDYYGQLEAARILKARFPTLPLFLVTLIHKECVQPEPFPTHLLAAPHAFIPYTDPSGTWETIACDPFPPDVKSWLGNAALILQIPTYYPNTPDLLAEFPTPTHECVGEFGWINTAQFHPLTDTRCMGLHFLEKGIFRKHTPPIEPLRNERLRRMLAEHMPTSINLAYTFTQSGFYLYVHALVKMCEDQTENITICFFHMGHLIDNMERLKPILKRLGVAKVLIHYKEMISAIPISDQGKTIRFIHAERLSHDDFVTLVTRTEHLIGCRGDGSISEALATGKPFFPDPPPHQQNFLKDVMALATHRLQAFPTCLTFVNLWISNLELEVRGEALGTALKHPETVAGMQQLSSIIHDEYAVNDTLCNLALRALHHHTKPEIKILEKFVADEFFFGTKNAKETLQEIAALLNEPS